MHMPGPLAAGFDGQCSTNSCALPELVQATVRAYLQGDAREGAALYRQWYEYRRFVRAAGQLQAVKAAMRLRGWQSGHVRAPLQDLDDEHFAELEQVMAAMLPVISGCRNPPSAGMPTGDLPAAVFR